MKRFLLLSAFWGMLGLFALACGNSQTKIADQGEVAKAPTSFDSMPAPGTKAFCPVMESEFEVK